MELSSVFATTLTGSNENARELDWHDYPWPWVPWTYLERPWHDNWIMCSYDVTGADFEFRQIRKELDSSMYNNTLNVVDCVNIEN